MVPRVRTAGSPIMPGELGESRESPRARSALVATSAWRGHRADDDGAALDLDAREPLDLAEVDQRLAGWRGAASSSAAAYGRRRAAWRPRPWRASDAAAPHGGRARDSSKAYMAVLRRDAGWPAEWEGAGPDRPAAASGYSAAFFSRLACGSAAQTACGVAGMAMSSWPSASVMALITAGGAAMAPASPQPLMPSGLDGQRRLGHADLERRQVVGPRHAVVHVARRHELAVLVVDRAFQQRLADALGDAAMHLALDDHRVDELAEIVDRRPARDLGDARSRGRSRPRRCARRPGR